MPGFQPWLAPTMWSVAETLVVSRRRRRRRRGVVVVIRWSRVEAAELGMIGVDGGWLVWSNLFWEVMTVVLAALLTVLDYCRSTTDHWLVATLFLFQDC